MQVRTALEKPEKRGPKPRRRIERHVPVPRKRKSERAAKLRKAHDLWRKIVYAKAPDGLCVRCQKRPYSDACHLFTKGAYPSIRFEIENGLPCCRSCHERIDSDFAAKEELIEKWLSRAMWDRLWLRAMSRSKMDLDLTLIYLDTLARVIPERGKR